MKDVMKKLSAIILCMIVTCTMAFPVTAQADVSQYSDAKEITADELANGTEVSGSDVYKIAVTKGGVLEVECAETVELVDAKGDMVTKIAIPSMPNIPNMPGMSDMPDTSEMTAALKELESKDMYILAKGTYYLVNKNTTGTGVSVTCKLTQADAENIDDSAMSGLVDVSKMPVVDKLIYGQKNSGKFGMSKAYVACKFDVPMDGMVTLDLAYTQGMMAAMIGLKDVCPMYAIVDVNGDIYAAGVATSGKKISEKISLKKGKYFYGIIDTAMGYTGGAYDFNVDYKVTAKSKVSSAKKSGESINVKLKKVTGATGYQVSYSTSKKFKKAKSLTTTKTTCKIKKIDSKKKYYVRVRPYTKIGKKTYYGAWS